MRRRGSIPRLGQYLILWPMIVKGFSRLVYGFRFRAHVPKYSSPRLRLATPCLRIPGHVPRHLAEVLRLAIPRLHIPRHVLWVASKVRRH
jgi:hypothetical protein